MTKKKDQPEVFEGAQNVPGGGPQDGGSGQIAGQSMSASEQSAQSQEERTKALAAEVADLKDKLLRKQADFENFRKRMLREREDAARYANAALLSDLIGLIDDFERAIHSGEESRDFSSFLQGITMIEKQLVEMLENRWGLKRFVSVGEPFDPNKHEAVQRVEGPVDARPTVVEDYQKGYYLHERVLRPARVKVMVPAQGEDAAVPDPAAAPSPTGQPRASRDGK
ncbi:MAG TPA: nucleotide exchange factor GrpE [Spirochaetia bacterium]|nr:nucleotide exchange factor GrpE [Spirochaetia bacterium]